MKDEKLNVIVGLFGRYEALVSQFDQLMGQLQQLPKDISLIIVGDGQSWKSIPYYQMLEILLPNATVVTLEQETCLPSVVYNKGLSYVKKGYVTFVSLLTDNIGTRIALFSRFLEKEKHNDNQVFYLKHSDVGPVGMYPINQNQYGFLQIERFFLIDEIFLPKKLLDKMGSFNETPILQADFDREFVLRLASRADFVEIGSTGCVKKDFVSYPFLKRYTLPKDLIDRYIIRCCRPAFPNTKIEEINQSFVNDIPDEYAEKIKNLCSVLPQKNTKFQTKYKILILGGYWEYHHNQICFFNYLENMVGQGFATYRPTFDFMATKRDIDGNDLVIFTRCRSQNILELIDYCNEKKIPTIYMIDDNWTSIAKDHPEQGGIFVPGNPNFDNFIDAIGKCSTTWLFSDVLREDLDGYARSFTKFKISVDPQMFEVSDRREKTDTLYIGFSGSLRYDDTAFRALARLARKHKNFKVVLVGYVSEEQRKLFRSLEFMQIDFASYAVYSKNISRISPDLLIAPLNSTRTAMSKCFNKYIESAIVDSVCLYSKLKPYTDVVKDGVNGFFVEEETENAWFQKLEEIVSDIPKLRQVQKNAYEDVIKNYTVEALLPEFTEKIMNIIENGVSIDD